VDRRPRTRSAEGTYHHGALREALLAAAESLIEEHGLEGFTLRECARRAGVSHGAPAHHFGDLRGLLSAFTAQSFKTLDALTTRYRGTAEPEPFAQLVAAGVAYLDYALANRARFQLMFRSDRIDFGHPPLHAAATRVHDQLRECVIAVLSGRSRRPDELANAAVLARTTQAWSFVHGFATLYLDNALFASQVGGTPERARRAYVALMLGMRETFEGDLD
jgi:AcrR family transcriptional regulator